MLADENIVLLCNELLRDTPAVFDLKIKNFKRLQNAFYATNGRVSGMFIYLHLLFKFKDFILEKIPLANLSVSYKKLIKHFFLNNIKGTSKKEVNHSLIISDIFINNELPDSFLLETMKKMRIVIINILNVYAKVIGVELTNLYEKAGVILPKKYNNVWHYNINKGATSYHVTHKLPSIALNLSLKTTHNIIKKDEPITKNNNIKKDTKKDKIQLIKDFNTHTLYTAFDHLILNDNMEGQIMDLNVWHGSQSNFNLNLDFIKDFLKNLYYI